MSDLTPEELLAIRYPSHAKLAPDRSEVPAPAGRYPSLDQAPKPAPTATRRYPSMADLPDADPERDPKAKTIAAVESMKQAMVEEERMQKRYPSLAVAQIPEESVPESLDAKSPLLGEFRNLATELRVSEAQAQKLLALHARALSGAKPPAAHQDPSDDEVAGWEKIVAADPDLMQHKDSANRVVARFGDEELGAVLRQTGLGNHPALARFVVSVAKALDAAGANP